MYHTIDSYNKALEINPDIKFTLDNLGPIYRKNGKLDK
jgi:hypothetical protein